MVGESAGPAATGQCCKVGRIRARYGFEELDAELVERWTGEESESLRDLERYLNAELVRAAVEAAGERLVDGEAANYCRLLRSDDVSEGNRVEATRRLQRQGVDVEALRESFVSHQTIHTHLRDCLGASKETAANPEQRVENTRRYLRDLQDRTERITAESLEALRGDALEDLPEFSVYVDLTVSCDACGRVVPIGDVFEHGGCPCQE